MKSFYLVPTVLLETTRPRAPFHAVSAPDDLATSIVIVMGWDDYRAQDEWEDLPNVDELPIWTWGAPAPTKLRGGFASRGVAADHTIGQAMRALRRHFPTLRP
jgi:hypothetical protein